MTPIDLEKARPPLLIWARVTDPIPRIVGEFPDMLVMVELPPNCAVVKDAPPEPERCPYCGIDLDEVRASGKIGHACSRIAADRLSDLVIHGDAIGEVREAIREKVSGFPDHLLEDLARSVAKRVLALRMPSGLDAADMRAFRAWRMAGNDTVLAIARKIGEHWRDQEGVNGALLDELADATK